MIGLASNPVVLRLLLTLAGLAAATFFGYSVGKNVGLAQWQRERAELAMAASNELRAAQEEVNRVRREKVEAMQAADQRYTQGMRRAKLEKENALAFARGHGMYVNAECPDRQDALPGAGAGASGRDAATRVRLSEPDAEFLIGIAADADEVVEQLKLCQAALGADRAAGR